MQESIYGNIVDIRGKKIFPGSVTVQDGRIARIAKAEASDLASFSFSGKTPFILPGFIDSFTRLEMTQLSPCEYARKALTQGVIGALCDCGDSTSVLGKKGILAMIANAAQSPFYFGFSAPATLHKPVYSASDVEALLAKPEVTHLGQISDFPSVILHDRTIEQLFAVAAKYNKPADGYAPGVTHLNLAEYCKSPVSTDHACRSYDDAVEKISAGLIVQVPTRDKLDFASMLPLFNKYADKLMLCSDIIFGINVDRGYLNSNVAEAVRAGCNVFGVLEAACINPVEHYRLQCGTLREGDSADFIVIDRFESCNVLKTYIKGECVYDANEKPVVRRPERPLEIMNRFSAKPISKEDIAVPVVTGRNSRSLSVCIRPNVNIIDTCDGELNTVRMTMPMSSKYGFLYSDAKRDIIKTVLVNRYGNQSPVTVFTHGFGFLRGAFAMSISHEEQHIVAAGVSDDDIILAVNKVIELKGGMVLAVDGKIKSEVPLPFAGLMSIQSAEEISRDGGIFFSVLRKEMGCRIAHPVRTLSYIADIDIPTIKVTARGLFNVVEQEFIPLIQ